MRVGITGTPGTGKTSVAKELDKRVISLKDFAKEKSSGEEINGIFEIDIERVKAELPEDYWIEGHLAHKLDLDHCIVLRTDPEKLKKRLGSRDYSQEKIDENVEAEAMDLILTEAVERHKVYEIDTTAREPGEVAEEIMESVNNRKERYGVVDWSDYF